MQYLLLPRWVGPPKWFHSASMTRIKMTSSMRLSKTSFFLSQPWNSGLIDEFDQSMQFGYWYAFFLWNRVNSICFLNVGVPFKTVRPSSCSFWGAGHMGLFSYYDFTCHQKQMQEFGFWGVDKHSLILVKSISSILVCLLICLFYSGFISICISEIKFSRPITHEPAI